jgi:hypothetical protein
MPEPKTKKMHVLVVVPEQAKPLNIQGIGGHHAGVDEWVVKESFLFQRRNANWAIHDILQDYRFPSLVHPMLWNNHQHMNLVC